MCSFPLSHDMIQAFWRCLGVRHHFSFNILIQCDFNKPQTAKNFMTHFLLVIFIFSSHVKYVVIHKLTATPLLLDMLKLTHSMFSARSSAAMGPKEVHISEEGCERTLLQESCSGVIHLSFGSYWYLCVCNAFGKLSLTGINCETTTHESTRSLFGQKTKLKKH